MLLCWFLSIVMVLRTKLHTTNEVAVKAAAKHGLSLCETEADVVLVVDERNTKLPKRALWEHKAKDCTPLVIVRIVDPSCSSIDEAAFRYRFMQYTQNFTQIVIRRPITRSSDVMEVLDFVFDGVRS